MENFIKEVELKIRKRTHYESMSYYQKSGL